ncbi:hypothetical protein BKA57DRAFT_502700 [Linnemannia elongata]|nr:hypothetical protein BKA57DRAFT_502700 [Linnemannia elongata]
MSDALVEVTRLRKRRPFAKRHLMLFLQLCSSLQYFALSDGSITFEDLIDSDSSNNSNVNKQQTTAGAAESAQQFIRPWARDDPLRTLKLSLEYLMPYSRCSMHSSASTWDDLESYVLYI